MVLASFRQLLLGRPAALAWVIDSCTMADRTSRAVERSSPLRLGRRIVEDIGCHDGAVFGEGEGLMLHIPAALQDHGLCSWCYEWDEHRHMALF